MKTSIDCILASFDRRKPTSSEKILLWGKEEDMCVLRSFRFCLFPRLQPHPKQRNHFRRRSRILVRGARRVWTSRGTLSPKFAQNRGFPLKKFPQNCILGALGARAPSAPWIRYCISGCVLSILIWVFLQWKQEVSRSAKTRAFSS